MPLMILLKGPNSPIARQLRGKLATGRSFDFAAIKALLGSKEFTPEHAKKVGEAFYALGISLLERAERSRPN